MKNLIIILSISIYFVSCKKTEIKNNLKGQLNICSNGSKNAYSNKEIELFQKNNGSYSNSKTIATAKTDLNGNFAFEYSTTNTKDNLIIRESSGFGFNNLITDLPIKNLDNCSLYLGNYNLVVNLNVLKTYTNNDTLLINNPKTLTYMKKAGPFSSGRLYKESNIDIYDDWSYQGNTKTLGCGLNSLQNLIFNKEYLVENSKLCGDTVFVTLDIR